MPRVRRLWRADLPWRISRSTRMPRYPSDMSYGEWAVTEPAMPARPGTLGARRRPQSTVAGDIIDGIRYLVKEGNPVAGDACGLPALAHHYDYPAGAEDRRETETMHDELRRQCRIAAGRTPEPTAAIIDSQSVKAPRPSEGPAAATTRARRSTAASGTSPSTRSGCSHGLITAADSRPRRGKTAAVEPAEGIPLGPGSPGPTADTRQARHLTRPSFKPKLILEIVKRHRMTCIPSRCCPAG